MARLKPPTIRIDPELARLSVGLSLAAQFRLWVVSRHLTRDDNGSGKVSKKYLKSILRRFEVIYTRQHINALLRAGKGLFWNADRQFLYLRSWSFVAKQLTQLALDNNPNLLDNKPGTKDILLSPLGSLEQWEASIYAGWLYHRDHPTISREVLSKLFGRTPETIRRWEQTRLEKTVTVQKNYAQTPFVEVVDQVHPEPVFSYVAKTSDGAQLRLMWQLSNTYKVKGIKEHHHKGQAPKVRKQVNNQLQQPANQWRGGSPVVLLYFDSAKQLRGYLKDHDGVYYLWRGRNRHKQGIFEATETGWAETQARERISFGTERMLKSELTIRL